MGACNDLCQGKFAYAVLQYQECWCSNEKPANEASLDNCNQQCPGYPDQHCGNKGAGFYGYVPLDGAPVTSSETTSSVSMLESRNSAPARQLTLIVSIGLFYLELYHACHDFGGRHKQLFIFRRYQLPFDRLKGQQYFGRRRGVLHRRIQQPYGPSCYECDPGCRHELRPLISCVLTNTFISSLFVCQIFVADQCGWYVHNGNNGPSLVQLQTCTTPIPQHAKYVTNYLVGKADRSNRLSLRSQQCRGTLACS